MGRRDSGLLVITGIVSITGLFLVVFVWLKDRRRRPAAARASMATAMVPPPMPIPVPRAVQDDESNMPRWLRPSLRAERFQTQPIMRRIAVVSTREPLAFDEPAGDSIARMVLRYDGVSLLDQPNESFAQIVGEVGAEDEVDILEVSDAWAMVRTPNGLTGWLPTMTLRGQRALRGPASDPAGDDGRSASGYQM